MKNAGIDYGLGRSNIDHQTGIRYGVISQHAILQAWADDSEPDYGKPPYYCPNCKQETCVPSDEHADEENASKDYYCPQCKESFWSDRVLPEEPIGYYLDDGEYQATDCLDSDVMVIKSPYFTYGPFCSPCVPGGVSLPDDPDDAVKCGWGEVCTHTDEESCIKNVYPRAYCFGHDWFEDEIAPYRVWRVEDGAEVIAERKTVA